MAQRAAKAASGFTPAGEQRRVVLSTTLKKSGGSLVLTVPAPARDALGLEPGQEMTIAVEGASLIVERRRPRPRYRLADLLAQCNPKAGTADEIDAWQELPPVGRELW